MAHHCSIEWRPAAAWIALPFAVVCILCSFVGSTPVQATVNSSRQTGQRAGAAAETAAPDRALLTRYCVTCHNPRARAGELSLQELDPVDAAANAVVWEKVVGKLRSGAMPPAGMPRPDKPAIDLFASHLETALDTAAALHPNPGRPAAHRLNRAEYTNAIRDLLDLEIDGRSLLPPDDSGYGFDNIGDVLSVSPALFDRYMIAAGTIARTAVGAGLQPVIRTYTVRPTLLQDDRLSEDLPFGSRGGIAIRHYFPVDGEYLLKIRLQRTHANQIRGLGEPNDVELRFDRARLKLFTVGGAGPRDPWSPVPSASAYEQTADDGLEIRLAVKPGEHLIGVSFPKKTGLPEGVLEPRLSVGTYEFAGDRDTFMGVESLTVGGPYNGRASTESPTHRRIFVCTPASPQDEPACTRRIVTALARRAYRRPVRASDVPPLLKMFEEGRKRGSFEAGIEVALRGILVDPEFLFRIERDPAAVPAGAGYALSDLELASRLSFFIWSSIPDDELLNLAAQGKLRQAAVLRQQVLRLLTDRRSKALVENFAGQWLYLRNMRSVLPDPEAFPEFDENLREAFQRETELFVDSQLRADRGVTEMLTADYTFLNERLARHYGIGGVYGSHFRRVTLSNPERVGLLGHASILTVTSYANRTSPTVRGKWVLENLLGAPPPPPPANVPSLDEAVTDGKTRSVRERLEQHRRNLVCATCHAQMDPLGFSLENFDGTGRWRSVGEGGTPLDTTATLPDGFRIEGASGLRNVLFARREQFVAAVTEKLMTYALGRGLEYYDKPAVRQVLRDAAPSEYRWSSLILGIVNSTPFQMRRSSEP